MEFRDSGNCGHYITGVLRGGRDRRVETYDPGRRSGSQTRKPSSSDDKERIVSSAVASSCEVPIAAAVDGWVPESWLDVLSPALDSVWLRVSESFLDWDEQFFTRLLLVIRPDSDDPMPLRIGLPLLPGVSLVIGDGSDFEVGLSLSLSDYDWSLRFDSMVVGLSFSADLAQAVTRPEGGAAYVAIEQPGYLLGFNVGFSISGRGSLRADPIAINARPVRIGTTGLIVVPRRYADSEEESIPEDELAATDDQRAWIIFSKVPEAFEGVLPGGWAGVWFGKTKVLFTAEDSNFAFEVNGGIGSGGFTGTLAYVADGTVGATAFGAHEEEALNTYASSSEALLAGSSAIIFWAGVSFENTVPTSGEIQAYLKVPVVDRWMGCRVVLGGPDCTLLIQMTGTGGDGLLSLKNKYLEITVDTLAYELRDGESWAVITGSVRPKFGDFDWPWLKVERLGINHKGDLDYAGGWMEVPETWKIDLGVAKLKLSAIGFGGFGEGEERVWVGLSGGVELVRGLPISASVEGLKVSVAKDELTDVSVTLDGIGLSYEMPKVLRFKGKVSHEDLSDSDTISEGDPSETMRGHIYRGFATLDSLSTRFKLDAQVLVGSVTLNEEDFEAFYLCVDLRLSAPIPLGTSGLGIYGFKGLFGWNMAPAAQDSDWWTWYKSSSNTKDVTDSYSLSSVYKWTPTKGELAFGAGIALGTVGDSGTSIQLGVMFVVLLPGPVVLIEGQADVLCTTGPPKREEVSEKGAFHALIVVDGRAGTVQVCLDMKYEIPLLLEVAGSLESFFNLHDDADWYIHLGQEEPEGKRISSKILSLLTAQSWLEISPDGIGVGAHAGYNLQKKLGPVHLTLVATGTLALNLSFRPFQATADFDVDVDLGLKIYGIGLEMALEIGVSAGGPRPYFLDFDITASIGLPWPLGKQSVKYHIGWSDDEEDEPEDYVGGATLVHHRLSGWEQDLSGTSVLVPPDARIELRLNRPVTVVVDGSEGSGRVDPKLTEEIGKKEVAYEIVSIELREGSSDAVSDTSPAIKTFPMDAGATDPSMAFDLLADSAILPSGEAKVPSDEEDGFQPTLVVNGAAVSVAQSPRWQLWTHTPFDRGGTGRAFVDPPAAQSTIDHQGDVSWRRAPLGPLAAFSRWKQISLFSVPGTASIVQLDQNGPHALQYTSTLLIVLPRPVRSVLLVYARPLSAPPIAQPRLGGRDFPERLVVEGLRIGVQRADKGPFDRLLLHTREASQLLFELSYASVTSVSVLAPTAPVVAAPAPGRTPVLKPDTSYRLKVKFKCLEKTKELNLSFQTLRGPGIETPDPLRDVGWTLASYVHATSPVDGERFAYSGDDVAVSWTEPYVQNMYPGSDALSLRILDREGAVLSLPSEGQGWSTSSHRLVPDGVMVYERARGVELPPSPAPRLWAQLPAGRRSGERLTAEVVASGVGLHRFSFCLSSWAGAADHLGSANGRDGQARLRTLRHDTSPVVDAWASYHSQALALRRARDQLSASVASSTAWVSALEALEIEKAALEALRPAAWQALDAWTGPAFANKKVSRTVLPRGAVELVGLWRQRADKLYEMWAVLVRSPEPVPWPYLRFYRDSTPLHPVPNQDGTEGFLVFPTLGAGGRPALAVATSGETLNLSWTRSGENAPELEAPTRSQTAVTESGTWTAVLDGTR